MSWLKLPFGEICVLLVLSIQYVGTTDKILAAVNYPSLPDFKTTIMY
jgi:hypothetical protein